MGLHLAVPNNLIAVLVDNPLRNDLMPAHGRPKLGPQPPVGGAKKQDGNANDGEDVVRISVAVPVSLGRDEWHNRQEHVAKEEDDGDGEVGVPPRCPLFLLVVVQIDETRSDEAVDPGAGVGVSGGGSGVSCYS